MLKSNRGITLIALVITIIVLLILAGVSISAVMGENGIATKAREAGNETEIAKEVEQIGIALSEFELEFIDDDSLSVVEFIKEKDWCSDAIYDEETATLSIIVDTGRWYQVVDGEIVEKGVTEGSSFDI